MLQKYKYSFYSPNFFPSFSRYIFIIFKSIAIKCQSQKKISADNHAVNCFQLHPILYIICRVPQQNESQALMVLALAIVLYMKLNLSVCTISA